MYSRLVSTARAKPTAEVGARKQKEGRSRITQISRLRPPLPTLRRTSSIYKSTPAPPPTKKEGRKEGEEDTLRHTQTSFEYRPRYHSSSYTRNMGLLDQLWDDTVAGPPPDHGLGKLRKYASSTTNAASVPSADVAAPAVTRSITILRPPALSVTSPRSESGSAPSSPSPASAPDSPFGAATTPRGEGWSKFRRKGRIRMAADGTDVASPGTPRSPTVYDWVVISSLDR